MAGRNTIGWKSSIMLRHRSYVKQFILVTLMGSMMFSATYYQISRENCSDLSTCQYFSSPNEKRNQQDLNRIKDVCKKYEGSSMVGNASSVSYYHTHVDDKNELLYCFIPKSGCTLWKSIYLILTGSRNASNTADIDGYTVHFRSNYSHLSDFSDSEIQKRLNTYFNFLVVRQPFQRLVSGYVDKFIEPGEEWFKKTHGTVFVEKYRRNATKQEIDEGIPTFPEFVSYLLDAKYLPSAEIDSHWVQYYKICNPCYLNYDNIIKFESIKEDTENLLKIKNLNHLVNVTYSKPGTSNTRLKHYMKQLTVDQIFKLFEAYKLDFELFGYEFKITDYF